MKNVTHGSLFGMGIINFILPLPVVWHHNPCNIQLSFSSNENKGIFHNYSTDQKFKPNADISRIFKILLGFIHPLVTCNGDSIKQAQSQHLNQLGPSFTMTPSNGNIFRVTDLLCGEFTGRWIPRTKASDAELWCFLWSAPGLTIEQTIETSVIWDAIALIMVSL